MSLIAAAAAIGEAVVSQREKIARGRRLRRRGNPYAEMRIFQFAELERIIAYIADSVAPARNIRQEQERRWGVVSCAVAIQKRYGVCRGGELHTVSRHKTSGRLTRLLIKVCYEDRLRRSAAVEVGDEGIAVVPGLQAVRTRSGRIFIPSDLIHE